MSLLSITPSVVKSHAQLVGDPVERSVNWTVSGADPVTVVAENVPDRGVAENAAVGSVPEGADIVIYPLLVSFVLPWEFVEVSFTVYVPAVVYVYEGF